MQAIRETSALPGASFVSPAPVVLGKPKSGYCRAASFIENVSLNRAVSDASKLALGLDSHLFGSPPASLATMRWLATLHSSSSPFGSLGIRRFVIPLQYRRSTRAYLEDWPVRGKLFGKHVVVRVEESVLISILD